MHYIDTYNKLYRAAITGRKNVRGRKYTNAYWLRVDEKDGSKLHVVTYHWGSYKVGDKKWERVPPAYRPYSIVATLDPQGITFTNTAQYGQQVFIVPEITKEKYPTAEFTGYGPNSMADSTLNNFMRDLYPRFRQAGNGVTGKPGLHWHMHKNDPVNVYGPVRYDAVQNQLVPLWPQPERKVKTELRKKINTSLGPAFKRIRVLTTMGVQVDRDKLPKVDQPTIEQFLKAAAEFDPQNHDETMRLVALGEALYGYRTAPWYSPAHPILSKGGQETLRRRINKDLKVVTYE